MKKRTSWNKGLKCPEIGLSLKGKHNSRKTEFKKGSAPWNLGKHPSEATRKKQSDSKIKAGIIPPSQKGIKLLDNHPFKVKGRIPWNKGIPHLVKEKNPNWKGGISFNPYSKEFTKELKLIIRTRDNFTCCLCKKTEREELEELNRVLCVNHIDFNKLNCKIDNLNTLCLRCNVKINREREYWTNYFQNL